MAPESFRDFFTASAAAAGALIGLLFVAISVAPGKVTGDTASAQHQVTAGASLSEVAIILGGLQVANKIALVGARDTSLLPTMAGLAVTRLQHPGAHPADPPAGRGDEPPGED